MQEKDKGGRIFLVALEGGMAGPKVVGNKGTLCANYLRNGPFPKETSTTRMDTPCNYGK